MKREGDRVRKGRSGGVGDSQDLRFAGEKIALPHLDQGSEWAGANDANYAKISGVGDASDAMANPCRFTRCSAFCRSALLQSHLVVVCFRPRFGPLRLLSPRFGPPG